MEGKVWVSSLHLQNKEKKKKGGIAYVAKGLHQVKHWHCDLQACCIPTRCRQDKPLTCGNKPGARSGKMERSGAVCSSVFILNFVPTRVKPTLQIFSYLQSCRLQPWVCGYQPQKTCRHHVWRMQRSSACSTWPQKPSSPPLESCRERVQSLGLPAPLGQPHLLLSFLLNPGDHK